MALLDDIETALSVAGLPGSGWALKKSYMPDSPDKVIVIYETGGFEPAQSPGLGARYPTFQAAVRGEKFGYAAAQTKLEAVYAALNNGAVSGLTYCYAMNSGPSMRGYDGKERPILAYDFKTMRPAA